MYIGVDYYPEQWPKKLLEEDLDRISDIGFDLIRIAEFAWHIIEPKEGVYDFFFFDEVLRYAKRKGLKVIFGTPTATMPAWLAEKYPEVISEDRNGNKRVFGGRRQYCFNSSIYQEYSRRIVEKLGEHYGNNSEVIGWQIDNEFGHEGSDMCYCDICHSSFQEFLKNKYKHIENLNNTYGTVFWSQTYNDFSEIPIPKTTITTHNPSLMQDFYRFRAESITKYAEMQISTLKKHISNSQFITHNFSGGLFDKAMDFAEIGKKLDVIGYDNYPVWGGLREPVSPHSTGFALDLMRGLKKKNFWVLEQLIGAQGHQIIGYLPRPNQAIMWAAQSVAHGAENIVFFRYRAAAKGAEQFCYGVIDHDNKEGRKADEIRRFIKKIKKSETSIEPEIKSEIAVLYDMDNVWSWKIQPQSTVFDYTKEAERLYSMFYNKNIPVDVLPAESNFEKYKIIVIPVMMMIKDNLAEKIESYVKNGGIAIFSFRSGIKDRDNNIVFNKTNFVYKISGLKKVEFEALQEGQFVKVQDLSSKVSFNGEVWRDLLKCGSAKPIFKYTDKFYKDYSAVTVNKYDNGSVYYIGTGLDNNGLNVLAEKILSKTNIESVESDSDIEVYDRGKIKFLINHSDKKLKYDGIKLEPYEFKVIKNKKD